MTWLHEVMDQTKEAETPRSFIYWGALSALSAVIGRNVYLDKHLYKLYPNIYVMLVAKSGSRKSFPTWLAKSLVERVGNTRIISGRNTIESVVTALATSCTVEGGGKNSQSGLIKEARAFLISGEFSNLLQENDAATTILTDLYDTHANDTWENRTKTGGTEVLTKPYLTLLGASNPTLLKQALPDFAYQGGFIGRTIMVQEDKRALKNSLIKAPVVTLDIDYLAEYLIGVSKLTGPFLWSPDGADFFEEWYQRYAPEESDDTTGTADRLHDQVLKVAMLISLAQSPELVLQKADIETALQHCLHYSEGVDKLSSASGSSDIGQPMALITQELVLREKSDFSASRVDLLRKFRGQIDKFILDKVVENMLEMQLLETFKTDGKVMYRLAQVVVDRYIKREKQRKNRI